jgi:hypothetical protein
MEGFQYLKQLFLILRSMAILFGGKYPPPPPTRRMLCVRNCHQNKAMTFTRSQLRLSGTGSVTHVQNKEHGAQTILLLSQKNNKKCAC